MPCNGRRKRSAFSSSLYLSPDPRVGPSTSPTSAFTFLFAIRANYLPLGKITEIPSFYFPNALLWELFFRSKSKRIFYNIFIFPLFLSQEKNHHLMIFFFPFSFPFLKIRCPTSATFSCSVLHLCRKGEEKGELQNNRNNRFRGRGRNQRSKSGYFCFDSLASAAW